MWRIKGKALMLFVPGVLLGALGFGPAVDCACAAAINSAQSGLWDDTNTWSTLTVPTANDNVTILGTHTVTLNNKLEHSVSNLIINANGTLTHSDNSTGEEYKIWLTIGSDCVINTNGAINVDYRGYDYGQGPGASSYVGECGPGGSHGGQGGKGSSSSDVKDAYGSVICPTSLGSGGNNFARAGYGGGAVKLAASNSITINGTISANGKKYYLNWSSGGAGGSIWIVAGTVNGNGSISANGGAGYVHPTAGTGGGDGGGGRIAFEYSSCTFTGTVSMAGGTNGYDHGATGTYFICESPYLGTSLGCDGMRLESSFSVSSNEVKITRIINKWVASKPVACWTDTSTDFEDVQLDNVATYTLSGLPQNRILRVYDNGQLAYTTNSGSGGVEVSDITLDAPHTIYINPLPGGAIIRVH